MKRKIAIAGLLFAALGSGLGSAEAGNDRFIREIVKLDGQTVATVCYQARPEQHCPNGVRVYPGSLLKVPRV